LGASVRLRRTDRAFRLYLFCLRQKRIPLQSLARVLIRHPWRIKTLDFACGKIQEIVDAGIHAAASMPAGYRRGGA
jgi:hypothetical protein